MHTTTRSPPPAPYTVCDVVNGSFAAVFRHVTRRTICPRAREGSLVLGRRPRSVCLFVSILSALVVVRLAHPRPLSRSSVPVPRSRRSRSSVVSPPSSARRTAPGVTPFARDYFSCITRYRCDCSPPPMSRVGAHGSGVYTCQENTSYDRAR